jgi:hypothetical protein
MCTIFELILKVGHGLRGGEAVARCGPTVKDDWKERGG